MAKEYSAPPIVEAIIEFRFSDILSFDDIRARADRFKRDYPHEETEVEVIQEFHPDHLKHQMNNVGLRLRSDDALKVFLLKLNSVATAHLAPYPGWEEFKSRALRDLGKSFDVFGRRKLSRVGMRFINRLDVPGNTVAIDDYLTVNIQMPEFKPSLGLSFALEATKKFVDNPYAYTIRSGTMDAPVPNTVSFLFDIDLFRTETLPLRDDAIDIMLDEMRELKNMIFELSITDKMRELFR